ncbi:MAG: hypothetical protein K9W43_03875 [Candidatus Thorarchaeota archaeon]|nr:hypothetical protein [Candidatus Thorarchaeota archaeon]
MGKGKKIIGLLVVIIVAVGIAAWHDGVIATTSIKSINDGDVDSGTSVAVKGKLTLRIGNVHTITALDSSNTLVFVWDGDSPAIDSIIVVRGVVQSAVSLKDVSSVQTVWIFK